MPTFDREKVGAVSGLQKGAYTLIEAQGAPKVVLIATGSEVGLAVEAQARLAGEGIATRVVSMPCMEAFAAQDAAYRESVLPAGTVRVSIEAATTFGWHRWVGERGATIGLDRFGASAPGGENLKKLGFTADNIVKTVKGLLG
jgi:transketolase